MDHLSVYRLETYRFDKKYRRFSSSNEDTFPDFYPDKFKPNWRPPRLAATWTPQKLIGEVWPENDFPGEGAPVALTPVFSQRAVEGLREFLEPNGELLSVITPRGTYYAYNLTTLVDAIDLEKSDIKYWPGSNRIYQVTEFVLDETALAGKTIFRFPQIPVEIQVTEPFVRRVEELKLNGMWITKCWPMPPGVRWLTAWNEVMTQSRRVYEEEDAREREARKQKKANKPAKVPKALDLRKDVDAIEALLKRTMQWIKKQQKGWVAKLEAVSAIGLETSGWDLEDGPLIMCNVDTREVHGKDGHWTYFNQMEIKMPKWTALLRGLDDYKGEQILIDVHGETHKLMGADHNLGKLFSETLVAAMSQAKANGIFKALDHPAKCTLWVADEENDFWWPKSGEPDVFAE